MVEDLEALLAGNTELKGFDAFTFEFYDFAAG
jgi:hypothetical protein